MNDHRVRLMHERLRALLEAYIEVASGKMQVWDYIYGCVGRLLDAASNVAGSDVVDFDVIDRVADHARKAVELSQHRTALMKGELEAEVERIQQTLLAVGKR